MQEDGYLAQDPVGEIETTVDMPNLGLPGRSKIAYKVKANDHFASMKVDESFFVKDRTVEAVKRWVKDWRRDLRATGKTADEKLSLRGFLCKHAIGHAKGNKKGELGVRVWRFK